MSAPYCKKGSRRCSVSKKCVKKSGLRSTQKCKRGTRRCPDGACYKKHKSVKSRRSFARKYGK